MDNSEYKAAVWYPTFKNDTLSIAHGRRFGVLTLSNNVLSLRLNDGTQVFTASPSDVKKISFVNGVTNTPQAGTAQTFVIRLRDKQHYQVFFLPSLEQTSGVALVPEEVAKAFEAQAPSSLPGGGDPSFSSALKGWVKENKIRSNTSSVLLVFVLVAIFFAYVIWKMMVHR